MIAPRLASAVLMSMILGAATADAGDAPWPGPTTPTLRARLLEQAAPLLAERGGDAQRQRLERLKAPPALEALLVMCDFADSLLLGRFGQVEGEFPPPAQAGLYYAAHDSVYFSHLLGDVADYFDAASGGAFEFRFTVHPRVVNLPRPMAFYGNHPEQGEQVFPLAAEVVDSLDAEIDFSRFDTLLLVHAGAGEETDILGDSPEQIYSTYVDPADFREAVAESLLATPYLPSDDFPAGSGLDHVLILPECEFQDPIGGYGGYFGSLGVYCFEVGLRLGMLSLSDFTPAGRPDSQGIGQFGLMGYGLFVSSGWIPDQPCAYNKLLMGWSSPPTVDPLTAGTVALIPAERTGQPGSAVRVDISGQEFWLAEYRQQDPDGNRIFSFGGDLNGNNVPDFWDASSPTGDGVPPWGELFDPATDTRERLVGAEWDFFMSEYFPAGRTVKGTGSGVYIWHIDEGLIRDVFDRPENLFNAEAAHKAVDVEEADGIQDLDSAAASEYLLGGDADAFRGEGAVRFGPDTYPPTTTATGARTGVVFADFSRVVLDSTAAVLWSDGTDTLWSLAYADTVTFSLQLADEGAAGTAPRVRRDLPAGTDLRGSHVLLVDLDAPFIAATDDSCGHGGPVEIVVAGRAGEIFVLDGNLDEVLDHDGDPATLDPAFRIERDGAPVAWNLPPAAGDLDGDGQAEIVLTGPAGLYALKGDGSAVRSAEPGAFGLYTPLAACALPPVLLAPAGTGRYCPETPVVACVAVQDGPAARLQFFGGPDAGLQEDILLPRGRVASPPVTAADRLFAAVVDTAGQAHVLAVVALADIGAPGEAICGLVPLTVAPGPYPLLVGLVDPGDGADGDRYVIVPAGDGGAETLILDAAGQLRERFAWDAGQDLRSPLTLGGAFVGDGLLGRVGHTGAWLDGWPQRPRDGFTAAGGPSAAGPLTVLLPDSGLPLAQYVFPLPDGRICGQGTRGEAVAGWPLAGPARAAGSPAVGRALGGQQADLVAIGTFGRITGLDLAAEELTLQDVATIALWEGVAAVDGPWPMWGANPWRNGAYDLATWNSPPVAAAGSGIVAGSLKCVPNPLGGSILTVRGSLRSPGRVRAYVYTLEGELVTASGWRRVSAPDPFAVPVDLAEVVTGMYLCRLVAEPDAGGRDQQVTRFAVVR